MPSCARDEYRRRTAAGLSAARAIVAPTVAILRAILAAHHVAIAGSVIANGRDPADWQPASKEPFVLTTEGSWDGASGCADLETCAPDVIWPIYVARPTARPLDAPAIDSRCVHVLGQLSAVELAGWMGHASIFALPSRYVPFGLSVLEAALCGCALVLGDLDTLREVCGDAAIYVAPGDPGALADAINMLAEDAPRRRALAAASRERALVLSPARMAAGYRALYDELIGATTGHRDAVVS